MKIFGVFVVFLSTEYSLAQLGERDSCVTPTGETGVCIPWESCSQYASYVQEGKDDPEKAKFLRDRICRQDQQNVYLCCPSGASVQSSGHIIPSESECGIPSSASSNQPGAWPWLAAIGVPDTSNGFIAVCAGTLITRRHVLSAASCFGVPQKATTVRLGEYHTDNNDGGEKPQDYRIILYNTDLYNSKTFENDIIVLPLDRDVVFNDYIRPACLPFDFRNNEFTGQRLTVVGWGKPEFSARQVSKVPVAGSVPVVSRTNCREAYRRLSTITVIDERNLCAGDAFADACVGDSGGPLNYFSPERKRYYVVGIVSFGVGCANPDFPGGYTRVSAFLDWITGSIY